MELLWNLALGATERGLVPDTLVRSGIRRLCAARLGEEQRGGDIDQFVTDTLGADVAPVPEKANEQHYEAPTELFELALGPRLKYSCCYWDKRASTLARAEEAALEITCRRARVSDGQEILELGCGWGALSIWMAERYPNSRILAVSNSRTQRQSIERRAAQRRLSNIEVVTRDMNEFTTQRRFDRVVSLEMFEHMRNYTELMRRISVWLRPGGLLFVHVFCHRRFAYAFDTSGATNWLGRHFFTGGVMPSADVLPRFQQDLQVLDQWRWDGTHYQKTAEAWLRNLDASRAEVLPYLAKAYGEADAEKWFRRWRVFFLACAELWGFDYGREWGVAHYLFENPPRRESEEWIIHRSTSKVQEARMSV